MRLFHALLLFPFLSGPAFAQGAGPAPDHHGRRTADQHFADANTTHDGKLTLDQAKSGYKSLVKSFPEIDANHRGYVTLDDIKAWKEARKSARHAGKTADQEGDALRPRPAMQRGGAPRAVGTSTEMTVPAPRVGVDLPGAPLDKEHAS